MRSPFGPSPRASVLALLVSLLATFAAAQSEPRKVELTGFGGYQVGGSSSSRYGRLTIDDAVAYGVMLDVRVRPDATLNFVYDRQETVLHFRDNHPFFPKIVSLDLAVEHYQMGGTVEFVRETLRPYFAVTLGATRFDALSRPAGDEWRFSLGVGVGLKKYFSDRVGLRLDGRVWPVFVNTSGGFFCTLPGGCLVSLEADALWQANAVVGLFVGF